MPTTVRAAILHRSPVKPPFRQTLPLSVETVRLDDPGHGEVLVRMAAAGLCHSDLSVINGDRMRPVPMALGHEASGIVERCGPGVEDLRPGDHVVMVFVPSCGHCGPCASGRPALCEPGAAANTGGTLLSGEIRIHGAEGPVYHHIGVSAFADAAVVSRRSLVKVPRHLPLDVAALFGCAVLTGVGAISNTADVAVGERVAVVGLGGVGLAAVLGALASGAAEVIAIDLDPAKLKTALALGATSAFDASQEGLVMLVRDATQGGVDVALETAGVAAALETAFDITRRGGRTVSAGLAHPDARFALSPVKLVAEERTLRGSYLGGGVPARDIARMIALFEAGRLPVDKLMTGTSPLDEINEAFDLLQTGAAVRHLISF
ncbi:MAG: zinc-binding dehydrogenase [Pseudomonadota bacterium]